MIIMRFKIRAVKNSINLQIHDQHGSFDTKLNHNVDEDFRHTLSYIAWIYIFIFVFETIYFHYVA